MTREGVRLFPSHLKFHCHRLMFHVCMNECLHAASFRDREAELRTQHTKQLQELNARFESRHAQQLREQDELNRRCIELTTR